MKKAVLLLFFVLLLATSAMAQTTTSSPASFDISKSGAGEGTALNVYSPTSYLQWETTGPFCLAPRYTIGLDSLPAQAWSVTVTKAIDTLLHKYEVQVQGYLLANRSVSLTYIDTLYKQQCVNGFYFPDRERLLRTGEPLLAMMPRDSLFSIAMTAGVHSAGQGVRIRIDDYFRVQGSPNGALATYSLPSLNSMTITDDDTFRVANRDTVYTLAIPGRFGFCTLFWKASGITSDTIPRFRIAYQVKYAGGDWAGPIDYYDRTTFALIDSLAIPHGYTRAYWPTTTPADSLRFRIIGCSNMGRVITNYIKALWRD